MTLARSMRLTPHRRQHVSRLEQVRGQRDGPIRAVPQVARGVVAVAAQQATDTVPARPWAGATRVIVIHVRRVDEQITTHRAGVALCDEHSRLVIASHLVEVLQVGSPLVLELRSLVAGTTQAPSLQLAVGVARRCLAKLGTAAGRLAQLAVVAPPLIVGATPTARRSRTVAAVDRARRAGIDDTLRAINDGSVVLPPLVVSGAPTASFMRAIAVVDRADAGTLHG
jgi:hypothetical protein